MAVIIHTKPGCPSCDKAETLLRDNGIPYTKVKYYPESADYTERRDAMFDLHGHRSFPNIFIGDAFVGGFAELKAMASTNRLEEMLTAAGISVQDLF